MGGCEHRAAEAAALRADSLTEEVFVALDEARRRSCFALDGARPASAIGGDAVGVKLGGDGGAGYRENVAGGGAGGDSRRGVGVKD